MIPVIVAGVVAVAVNALNEKDDIGKNGGDTITREVSSNLVPEHIRRKINQKRLELRVKNL